MMINNQKTSRNHNGRLNVFSISPKTGRIETTLISTDAIKCVKSSMQGNQQINTLIYRTKDGLAQCSSLSINKEFTEKKLKSYFKKECAIANQTGNVVDVLL